MKGLSIAAALLALAGCGSERRGGAPEDASAVTPEPSGPPVVQQVEGGATEARQRADRDEEDQGSLRIEGPGGTLRMRVACTGSPVRLIVEVPAFTPIGSEDRFALALGQEPVTLVADPTRQEPGGGVTAEGPVPENFAELLAAAGEIGALYGVQRVGPQSLDPGSAAALARACAAR